MPVLRVLLKQYEYIWQQKGQKDMNLKNARVIIGALSFAALLAAPAAGLAQEQAYPKDPATAEKTASATRVLATVGSEKITEESVFAPLSMMPPQLRSRYETAEGRKKLLDRSVQMSLLSQEARRLNIDKKEAIARRVKEMSDQLIVQELTKQEILDKIKITDADVQQYYNQNKNSFVKEGKIRVCLIMLQAKDSETEQVKTQKMNIAQQALARIKKGEDFEAVAKEISEDTRSNSRGGNTGLFSRGSRAGEYGDVFEQKAFSLQLNEVSEVFSGKDGFYIIKVMEKKAQEQEPFEEVKQNIEHTMKTEKQKTAMESYLEGLKKKYPVKMFDESQQ